jgi:hypothetical protein
MVLSKSQRFNSMTCCTGQWKGFKSDKQSPDNVPKFIALPGNYRPLVINPHSTPDISIAKALLKSNQFKARPLKQWRKQYGNYNNRQSNRARNLLQQYSTPGGYMVQTARENTVTNPCECSGNVRGVAEYTLGEFTQSKQSSGSSYDYSTCTDVSNCILTDAPSKAKRRTRTSYNVPCSQNSYSSYYQYNHARCKEYDQNMNGELRYGDSTDMTKCSCDCSCSGSSCSKSSSMGGCYYRPENDAQSCRKRAWEKPNNKQFWQQGAVSSGSRILRLKLNTLNTTANSIGVVYGKGSANALTYNGNPAAPFITKNKMNAGGYAIRRGPRASKYPVDANAYYTYLTNKKRWHGQNVCVKDCL